MAANTGFLCGNPAHKGNFRHFASEIYSAFDLPPYEKIPTTWVRIECRGFFSYEVLKNPLRIGFSPRKAVFEPIVVVGIFI